MIERNKKLPQVELTGSTVMQELGPGFLEIVYKNALLTAMRQKGLQNNQDGDG